MIILSPSLLLSWIIQWMVPSIVCFQRQHTHLTHHRIRFSHHTAAATTTATTTTTTTSGSFLPTITALGYKEDIAIPRTLSHPSTLPTSKSSTNNDDGDEDDPIITINMSTGTTKKKTTTNKKKKRVVHKHLFRNYGDVSFDSWLRCQDPESFLQSVGYSVEEIRRMEHEFPSLLTLNVHDNLAPKVRFLVQTLNGGSGRLMWRNNNDDDGDVDVDADDDSLRTAKEWALQHAVEYDDECNIVSGPDEQSGSEVETIVHSMRVFPSTRAIVPATFFGCQLDRVVGPFHAYLQMNDLPHGKTLLDQPELLQQFLTACGCGSSNSAGKSLQNFVSLCEEWRNVGHTTSTDDTEADIEDFVSIFGPGLIPASRGGVTSSSKDHIPIMLSHGANPMEYDCRGITPLMYAAGSGSALQGFQALAEIVQIEHEHQSILELLDCEREPKDGATALHWACCGVHTDFIGRGGSLGICQWIFDQQTAVKHNDDDDNDDLRALANMVTWYSKSTPVMWAAWAGSIEIVDLLVGHGANLDHVDSKGRNALHWALAAGHVEVLDYVLKQTGGQTLLYQTDHDGMSPVDYARLYDRQTILERIEELTGSSSTHDTLL